MADPQTSLATTQQGPTFGGPDNHKSRGLVMNPEFDPKAVYKLMTEEIRDVNRIPNKSSYSRCDLDRMKKQILDKYEEVFAARANQEKASQVGPSKDDYQFARDSKNVYYLNEVKDRIKDLKLEKCIVPPVR